MSRFECDESSHFILAIYHANSINLLDVSAFPPLFHNFTGLFYLLFGKTYEVTMWSLVPFALLFIISLFLIGEELGGPFGAVSVMLIGAGNPHFINFTQLYMLDMPMIAMLTLNLLFFLKSRMFLSRKYSYLFGFSLALLLLTRITSIAYISGLFIVIFLYFSFQRWYFFLCNLALPAFIALMAYLAIKYVGVNAKVFLAIKPALLLEFLILIISVFVFYLERNVIRDRSDTTVSQYLCFVKSMLITAFLASPFYVFKIPMFLSRMTDYNHFNLCIDGPRGDILLNLNYHALAYNTFFPNIHILVIAGILFFMIRHYRVIDMMAVLTMGITGFIYTHEIMSCFFRYLLGEIPVFAILGGYWTGQIGRLKYLLLTYVLACSILPLGAIFLFPDNLPNYEENYMTKKLKPFSTEVVLPNNPENDISKLHALKRDILSDINKRWPGRKLIGLYSVVTRKFCDKIVISNVFDSYSFHLHLLLDSQKSAPRYIWQCGKEINHEFFEDKTNRDIPIYLIVCYINREKLDSVIEWVTANTGRRVELVSRYCVPLRGKIYLYLIHPVDKGKVFEKEKKQPK